MKMLLAGLLLPAMVGLANPQGAAQRITVAGQVSIVGEEPPPKSPDNAHVVVWLEPLGVSPRDAVIPASLDHREQYELVQKNKEFKPHLLVVPVGSWVKFPNRDPFFHNVFSLFDGQRFDLGLYESGTTRSVLFDRPGICYIFCNIHAQMAAVVVVLESPYYSVSDRRGEIRIPGVPPGRYVLKVWNERSLPKEIDSLTRQVSISQENDSLGTLRVDETGYVPRAHKNLYGQDYIPAAPHSAVYEHR